MAPRIGTILDDRYELICVLGEGGMGTVFKALHVGIGRHFAVKVSTPIVSDKFDAIARCKTEAMAAASINHPNIAAVTDNGMTPEGEPYLVMEYLKGRDLSELLAELGVLPVQRAAAITVQVLDTLSAAHAAGIIHRDLKPGNVFLINRDGNDDFVKLLDFGICKYKPVDATQFIRMTRTGLALGTPAYMSPEQAQGDPDIGPPSDIYSTGVVLYKALTGKTPFNVGNYNVQLEKKVTDDPEPIETYNPDIPPGLSRAIGKALAREVSRRYATCDEFRADLEPFAMMDDGATAFRRPAAEGADSALMATVAQAGAPQLEATTPVGERAPATTVKPPRPGKPRKTAIERKPVPAPAAKPSTAVDASGETAAETRHAFVPTMKPIGSPPAGGSRGRRNQLIVLGSVALLLAALAAGLALRPEGQNEPAVPAATPSPRPAEVSDPGPAKASAAAEPAERANNDPQPNPVGGAAIEISVSATPTSARILIDGVHVGGPTFTGKFPTSEDVREIRVVADGYLTQKMNVPSSDDVELTFNLERDADATGSSAHASPSEGETASHKREHAEAPPKKPGGKRAGKDDARAIDRDLSMFD